MVPTLTLTSENNPPLTERRRRSRLAGDTLGWLLPAQQQMALHLPAENEGWEVIVHNLSRFGVGFASTESLRLGEQHRLRIGRGPVKRARLIRVVACRQNDDRTWAIGAEFVNFSTKGLARAG
jgi:hypothetical protein